MAMIEAGPDVLILKRASASRSSGQWSDDDFDVLANGTLQTGCRPVSQVLIIWVVKKMHAASGLI